MIIEYNCRMGDPETESVLPRIENDLVELFVATSEKRLKDVQLKISPKSAATVMIVAGGYPGDYEKGKVMAGIDNLRKSLAFHAGTTLEGGLIKSNGGRVLAVTSLQDGLPLDRPPFELERRDATPEILADRRIGITRGADTPWRFLLAGSAYLSKPVSRRRE